MKNNMKRYKPRILKLSQRENVTVIYLLVIYFLVLSVRGIQMYRSNLYFFPKSTHSKLLQAREIKLNNIWHHQFVSILYSNRH